MRFLVLTYVSGVLVGLGVGCTTYLSSHCANLNGDQTCAERGLGAFCNSCEFEANGCSDLMPSAGCRFPGAEGGASSDALMSEGVMPGDATSGSPASDGSSGEGGDGGSTNDDVCMSHAECDDLAAPVCNMMTGQCVPCSGMPDGDAACEERNPKTPICDDDTCVVCTGTNPGACGPELLACDTSTGACVPCTEHDQCISGACDIVMNTCFDPAMVVDVGSEGVSSIGVGLTALRAKWPDALGSRRGVLVLHGDANLNEAVEVGGMAGDVEAIAFMAAPAESPTWLYTKAPSSPTLTIEGEVRAYLDGVTLRDNADSSIGFGLTCDGGLVDVRRSRIVNNESGAILVLGSCELRVENSFIGVNTNDATAVEVFSGGAAITMLYSTLATGEGDYASALFCSSMISPSVEVRNSLLGTRGNSPAVACMSAMLTDSVVEGEDLPDWDDNWFLNYINGDYHLTSTAPHEIQAAVWQHGDPTTDIDGNPRVTDGTPDHAGADVPVP